MKLTLLLSFISFLLISLMAERPAFGQLAPPKPKPTAENEVRANDFFGSLEGNSYTNNFLGISLTVPEKYVVMNRAEISVYANASSDLMKGGGAANDRKLDEAVQNQAILLMIAQLQPGSAGNAIFEMSVRKQASGVTANMVLAESMKMMTASPKTVLKRSLPRTRIAGRDFAGVELETDVSGVKLKQIFHVTIHRGYALVIALTHAPGADESAFDSMLSGMVLKAR